MKNKMGENIFQLSVKSFQISFSHRKGRKGGARFAKNKRMCLRSLRNPLCSLRLIPIFIILSKRRGGESHIYWIRYRDRL